MPTVTATYVPTALTAYVPRLDRGIYGPRGQAAGRRRGDAVSSDVALVSSGGEAVNSGVAAANQKITVVSDKVAAYSLLECLFVLAILSITLSIAIPNYSALMQRGHIENTTHSLMQLLQQARTLALRQETMVEVCGSSQARNCDGDWQVGVRITWGNSANTSHWFYHAWPNQRYTITFYGALAAKILQFKPTGDVVANGRFTIYKLADAAGGHIRSQIMVSHGGRLRQEIAS